MFVRVKFGSALVGLVCIAVGCMKGGASAVTAEVAKKCAALRSADVNVVLIGEHVAVATAQAADPTMNDRGMEALQCAPVGNSSSFAVPPNMSPAIRSIKIRPNPGWAGDFTVGPSLSRQLRRTDFGAKSQRIMIFPAGTESAPYFEALVASSCKIMPNDWAA
jgi:hypothetical protein